MDRPRTLGDAALKARDALGHATLGGVQHQGNTPDGLAPAIEVHK
ncbi:hypothetical protein OAE79_01945 [Rhodopirellula sp.]|nr:hypothetical protein [Rhodopirellula sp.]MDB4679078.1 hypothetical protein [Rhodopirellula sp.]